MNKDEALQMSEDQEMRPCKVLLIDTNNRVLKMTEFTPICLKQGDDFSLTINYKTTFE